MELQLGLALPTTSNNNFPVKGGLDLNINDFLYHPTSISDGGNKNKKRSFTQAFEPSNASAAVPRTLPWLLWNNQQPNDDDDEDDTEHGSPYTIVIKNEEADGLVGWPPVKSWKKETCFHVHGDGGGRPARTVRVNGGGSTFVKVKMEGVGIARKIDLSQHQNFRTLLRTLMHMFDKCDMDSDNYKLTYQDSEGDWLLAHDQDVPWRTFVRSVQRLRLIKKGDE